MAIVIVIVILAFAFFVFLGKDLQKKELKIKDDLNQLKMNVEDFIPIGAYVGGHVDQDEVVNGCHFISKENSFIFYQWLDKTNLPIEKFSIKKNNIKSITVEDVSSIEKSITLGRVLLVGVFALAWQKKKKNDLFFIIINWNDGKFNHSTTFSFEGVNSSLNANSSRNKLIKLINELPQ